MSEETPGATPTLEVEVDEEKRKKRERAAKLAAQAREALAEAEKAEQESAKYKGSAVRVSMGSELNAKSSLGRMAEITYGAWTRSFLGSPAQTILGPSDGMMTNEQKKDRVKAVFERMDIDSSGGICKEELTQALGALGLDTSPETIDPLFREADTNGDKMIDFDEFNTVMTALMTREEASTLVQEMEAKAAEARIAAAPKMLKRDDVLASLSGGTLVGGEEGEIATFLNGLKEEGQLQKWGTVQPKMKEYSVERLVALTGVQEPDEELGIQVTGLVRKRLQITQFAGLSALLIVFFAGLLPDSIEPVVRQFGWGAFAVNLGVPLIANQLDSALVDYELGQDPDSAARWARRQAGRFLAAYLVGVPLAEVDYESKAKPELVVASKQSGNIDLKAAREATNTTAANAFEAALAYGLTPQQVQAQAVIQTAGVMAEYYKYGDATLGYMFLDELDRQLMLSQSFVDPFAKTTLARFGFVESAALVKANKGVIDELQVAVTEQRPVEEMIAIIESYRPSEDA